MSSKYLSKPLEYPEYLTTWDATYVHTTNHWRLLFDALYSILFKFDYYNQHGTFNLYKIQLYESVVFGTLQHRNDYHVAC